MQPTNIPESEEITRRFPAAARMDALEWSIAQNLNMDINKVLTNEVSLATILSPGRSSRITDDRPLNEYYLLGHLFGGRR
jgi:hypothetical protein